LQLDLVAVSGTNQYSVKPLALVTTATPPIFAVFKVVLDEPGRAVETALTDDLPAPAVLAAGELPHAAALRATAARPAVAHHRFCIMYPPPAGYPSIHSP
jgi:hypothetical protein